MTMKEGRPGRRRRRELQSAAAERLPADALAEANLTIERAIADLRALAALARSSALPPAKRVEEIERTALGHLERLRASLNPPAVAPLVAQPAVGSTADEPAETEPSDAPESPEVAA